MRFISPFDVCWSPRSIFIVAFLCCIIAAQAATAGVDVRFDKGSASLALNWQTIKGTLPHGKIPADSEQIQDVGSWGMDYGIGLAKLVGVGFVIAILTILCGVLYGLFKLFRFCCCHMCKSKDDEEGEEDESEYDEDHSDVVFKKVWCPTIAYAICWIFILTGMIFGLLNNPRFSEGVNDMGDSVVDVGNSAIELGRGLISNVSSIATMVPDTIQGIQYQFSGINPLADSVESLSDGVARTSTQVTEISNDISEIDAGNTPSVSGLVAQLQAISSQSQGVNAQMDDLTNEVANDLRTTYTETISSLDEKEGEIDSTVDELEDTAQGIIDTVQSAVDQVSDYVDIGKGYDATRGKALLGLFIFVIIITFAIVIGYLVRVKAIFNVIAAICFVLTFLLWFSGSIHFLLGMVLYDACPIIDVTVQGLLPQDSEVSVVLRGCLYENRSVFESMNITAYNLTEVFDYKSEFEGFANFSKNFDFQAIDTYFASINQLGSYNLNATADNMTVANFNWNESQVYNALQKLNDETTPTYNYDLQNYTDVDPNSFAYPKNNSVAIARTNVTTMIQVNATIYNKTETAQRQLRETQAQIDTMLADSRTQQAQFNGIQTSMSVLGTENITNCIDLLDDLQVSISGIFELGDCSFLGDNYLEIRTSLCETMQPAIDCLTVAQFLAGLALIPIVILAEFMSFHVPKHRISPCSGDDEERGKTDSYKLEQKGGGGGYAVAMTESPAVNRRLTSLTATVGQSPSTSTDNSPAPSPDFNVSRRVVAEHYENRLD